MCPRGTTTPISARRPGPAGSARGRPGPPRGRRGWRAASGTPPDVPDDLDVVDDDEAFLHQLVELRQEGVDPLALVDDDDRDRQILGQAEEARRVDVATGAEALDAAHHGRARETGAVRAVHDLRVERVVVVLVALAEEDRQAACGTGEPHRRASDSLGSECCSGTAASVERRARYATRARPTARPSAVAARPANREPKMSAAARP